MMLLFLNVVAYMCRDISLHRSLVSLYIYMMDVYKYKYIYLLRNCYVWGSSFIGVQIVQRVNGK